MLNYIKRILTFNKLLRCSEKKNRCESFIFIMSESFNFRMKFLRVSSFVHILKKKIFRILSDYILSKSVLLKKESIFESKFIHVIVYMGIIFFKN